MFVTVEEAGLPGPLDQLSDTREHIFFQPEIEHAREDRFHVAEAGFFDELTDLFNKGWELVQ
jgi:hypothetical protein